MKNIFITTTACIIFLLAGTNAGAQNNAAKPQEQTPALKKPVAGSGQAAVITDPKATDITKNITLAELKAEKPKEGLTPKNIDRPRTSTIVDIPKKTEPAVIPAPQVTTAAQAN